jgi:hypothetical protein
MEYNHTYANTPSAHVLRILLAMGAKYDWEIKQGDIHTAFLHAKIDTTIFITLPERCNDLAGLQREAKRNDEICHELYKALPGAPQGPHLFQNDLFGNLDKMKEFGFKRLPDEPSVFVSFGPGGIPWRGALLILMIFVDDLFLFHPKACEDMADRLWKQLQDIYDLPDRVDIDVALSMKVRRDRAARKLYVSQETAISELLKEVGMQDCNGVDTPGKYGFLFTKGDSPEPPEPASPMAVRYRKVVCSAIHIATWTRGDCATVVSRLASFLQNPGEKHWEQATHLLKYLQKTKAHPLTFDFSKEYIESLEEGPLETSDIKCYFDSSINSDVDSGRSMMGCVILFFGNVVHWRSRRYSRVTTATNESEYCAGAQALSQMQAVTNLVHHVGFTNLGVPMVMLTDNNGAHVLITNPGPRAKSRQMQLEEHKLREAETLGITVSKTIQSKDNPADAMTKILKPKDHKKFKPLFAKEPPIRWEKGKAVTEYEKSLVVLDDTVGEPGGSKSQLFCFSNSTVTCPCTTDLQMSPDCDSFGLIARAYTGNQLLSLHESTGHRNFQDIGRIYGIPIPKNLPWCRYCVENKAERHPSGHSRGTLDAPRAGYMIHADTAGPFPQQTKGGNRYFSLLVDGFSNRMDLQLINTPGEFYDHFKAFVHQCESHFGRTNVISVIHSDSATYYKDSDRMRSFTASKGIRQSFSPAYTQSLNGKAERNIRTIIEMARTCLNASGLPRQFYGEAIMYAVTVLNHIPRKGSARTPDEIWQGRSARKVVRQKFMPFGCAAWAQVLGPDREKFDRKAELQVHLNYDPDQHAYRIASLPHYRITYSGHLHFNKGIYPCREGSEHYDDQGREPIPRQRFHVSHYEQSGSEQEEEPEQKKRTREPSAQFLRNIAAGTK